MKEKVREKCLSCGILFVRKRDTKGMYCDQRCKSWSQVKARKVPCYGCGKILRRARSELKRTKKTICSPKCKTSPKEIDQAKKLRAEGLSFRKIGEELGFGRTKAERLCKSFKIKS